LEEKRVVRGRKWMEIERMVRGRKRRGREEDYERMEEDGKRRGWW
jgi:hypothetical protein